MYIDSYNFFIAANHDLYKTIFTGAECASVEEAEDLFIDAMNRLLHISKWGTSYPPFQQLVSHTDGRGKATSRAAHKGDHVKFNDTWQCILNVVYNDFPDISKETIEIQFSLSKTACAEHEPIKMPMNQQADLLMIVERLGKKMSAECYIHKNLHAISITDDQWKELLTTFLAD